MVKIIQVKFGKLGCEEENEKQYFMLAQRRKQEATKNRHAANRSYPASVENEIKWWILKSLVQGKVGRKGGRDFPISSGTFRTFHILLLDNTY